MHRCGLRRSLLPCRSALPPHEYHDWSISHRLAWHLHNNKWHNSLPFRCRNGRRPISMGLPCYYRPHRHRRHPFRCIPPDRVESRPSTTLPSPNVSHTLHQRILSDLRHPWHGLSVLSLLIPCYFQAVLSLLPTEYGLLSLAITGTMALTNVLGGLHLTKHNDHHTLLIRLGATILILGLRLFINFPT